MSTRSNVPPVDLPLLLLDRTMPVAAWRHCLSHSLSLPGVEPLEEIVDQCIESSDALRSFGLLTPTTMVLSHWCRPGNKGEISWLHRPPLVVALAVASTSHLREHAQQWFKCWSEQRDDTMPTVVEILGTGTVWYGGSAITLPDVTWIRGEVAPLRSISIGSQVDVWMTHDLKGNPQPAVHRHNAARLIGALVTVATTFGVGSLEAIGELTDQIGYEVRNWTDGDQPLPPVEVERLLERAARARARERAAD